LLTAYSLSPTAYNKSIPHHEIPLLMRPAAVHLHFHNVEVRARGQVDTARAPATEYYVIVIIPFRFVDHRAVPGDHRHPVFRIVADALDHQKLVDAVAVRRYRRVYPDRKVGR